MIVQVKLYTKLREVVGRENLKLNLKRESTVQDALDRLIARYGKELSNKLSQRNNWVIMLNDKNIKFLKDLRTRLKEGDQVSILNPLSGG